MLDVVCDRLRAQGLVRPLSSAAEVVSHLLAVQSQDLTNARWAVGQRVRGATDADIERAYDAGEIVRTHVLRPTWHFVAPADLRWLLELTGPRIHQLGAYYYKQTGQTAAKLRASNTKIARALRGTTMTRDELGELLGLEGTVLAYVVMHAEIEGVICSGPRRGKHITYALLDERVPAAPARTRDDALAELARRYVTSHGPAQLKDLAWWSGLTLTDVRRATELANLERVEADGVEYFHVPPQRRASIESTHVRLLPNYDELLIGFADRSAHRDPRIEQMDETAFFAHFIVSRGRLIGGYRRVVQKGVTVLDCTLVVTLTADERRALEREAQRFAAFIGSPVKLALRVDPTRQARPSMTKTARARQRRATS